MGAGSIVAVVVPLVIFLLTAAGGGIVGLIKLTSYFAASKVAQESTAETNTEIANKLDLYCRQTDGKLTDLGERMRVVEYATKTIRDIRG
jgi:hypothetical protein